MSDDDVARELREAALAAEQHRQNEINKTAAEQAARAEIARQQTEQRT